MGFGKLLNYKLFLESIKGDMWSIIPESVKDLQNIFSEKGKKLYVVGGAVRDFLKGDKPKDFDLCTDALPDEVLEIIGSDYKTNLQGKSFGVVVVYTDDQPMGMEIATFRSDTYDGKSRNPKVEYTTIDNDVNRRDLSINALFYDLEKREIIDLVGGISDLESRVIRMVGDPEKRIEEDPLRIMRSVRFAYRYGYKIEEETAEDIIKVKKSLQRITKERIWEEIKKSWGYNKNFKEYLDILSDLDLLVEIFPKLEINDDIKECKELVVYLANILRDNNPQELEKTMINNLKIESDVTSKVCHLIRLLDLSPENAFQMYKDRVKCHVTDKMISEWGQLSGIDSNLLSAFIKYKPSVSAQDLMDLGYKGPQLGKEISRLEEEKFRDMI